MKDIKIGKHFIGPGHAPFVIAEMSGNHNQSLDRALAIVEAAAAAGAHALKLQTYTADTMTIDIDTGEFFIDDPNSLWKGRSLYSLYKEAFTPWEWHEPIMKRCEERGIVFFSTPFDETAVDFLEDLNVPCYKIASFENVDIPLIRKVAATGKPMIVSTGMATASELDEMVREIRASGCQDLVLLKCTSTYPADPGHSNLNTLSHMRELFDCEVGISDHTLGIGVSIAAVSLGAVVVEKHFTLSRMDGAIDSAFSLEPKEMEMLVAESKRAWRSLGEVHYGPTENERKSLRHRRSLYIVKDIAAGETFSFENVRSIRPGLGLPPKYIDIFIGRKAGGNIKKGTPLSWDHLAG